MTTTTCQMMAMCRAARELASDEVLFDPSDDEILIAAAELAPGCDRVDLLALSDGQRLRIVQAFDAVDADARS